ncbi:MAG: class II aldolase/adducin family protein [Alphaproteobacteria bacterium]
MATPLRRIDTVADPVWQARVDLAAAHRLAARYGFDDGIWNHFTLMVPGTTDRFLVKPHGLLMSEVTASSLITATFDGKIVGGQGTIETTAYCIHSEIHRMHAHAACVLHCHPQHATWLCNTAPGRLLNCHQDLLSFDGQVAYDDIFPGSGATVEEGRRIAAASGGKSLLMSASHGLTAMSASVAEAWYDLYYFERACKTMYMIVSSGLPMRIVAQDIVDESVARGMKYKKEAAELTYEAQKRSLDREQPDYKT